MTVDTSHFRQLGCVAMVKIPKEQRRKWSFKARIGMLVGYDWRSPKYRIWIPDRPDLPDSLTGKIFERSDVDFLENTGYWAMRKKSNGYQTPGDCHCHPDDIDKLRAFIASCEDIIHLDSMPTLCCFDGLCLRSKLRVRIDLVLLR